MNKMRSVIVACGVVFLTGVLTVGGALARQNAGSTQQSLGSTTVEATSVSAAIPGEIKTVNINTADAAALQKIKGFGKKKSLAVIDYRNKNGQFKSLEDLLKVESRGISQKWLNKISKFLTL